MHTASSKTRFLVSTYASINTNSYHTHTHSLTHSLIFFGLILFFIMYFSGGKNKMKSYPDTLNPAKVQRPPTVVIVPRKPKHDFIVDITYVDFTWTLDIPGGISNAECYIVPPYKPVLFVASENEKNILYDVYTLTGNKPLIIITSTSLFPFNQSNPLTFLCSFFIPFQTNATLSFMHYRKRR